MKTNMQEAVVEEVETPIDEQESSAATDSKQTYEDLAEQLASFRQMVDTMPINVMMCDPVDLKINYINQTSIDTLKTLEHLLPVKADELLGQCIDIFHKDPSHQRKLLGDPKNLPHQAHIGIGDETLDLLVTAIMDKDGGYIGPMLSWSVITEKVKADADAARLTQMVDNMPINVMMCDPETMEINYVNQTSIDTLKTLEDLLPVKADELLGQCIDVFHKNPAHQRNLLGDPKNLPHQARIGIGDETLDLKVSAIMGKDGGYIGPMLSWSIITNIVDMTNNFERHVKGVVQTVASASTELQASAEEMSSIAKRTSEQSSSVSAAAEEATTNVQTVAAAAEELSSSISEISRQVSKSSEVAQNAVTQAEETNVTVEGLAEAAQKIGDVVSLINDIAGQTNLLALNATIEAARAGDAGRGFAVVASEVKNLANQTAKATEEIGNQIGAIQGATGEAVGAIKGIGSTIKEINEIAASIASAVEEQGAATSEISRNVQEAATGTQEVTGTISQVAAAADEAGQSAGQVLTAASELSQQSETLGKEIEVFINKE